MSSSDVDSEASGLEAVVARGLRELQGRSAARFIRGLAGAMLWQALGKVLQVAGLAYAFRCLGPEFVGLSGTVFVVAAFGQLALDFGLDIVSVRHTAAKTVRLEDLIPAMFSLRLLVGAGVAVAWLAAVALSPAGPVAKWVWALGAPHLFFLVLNFTWLYQARERVPQVSMIQNGTAAATSLYFLLFFRPGQAAGSDLLVTMLLNALVTALVWADARRRFNVKLFQLPSLSRARGLFAEGRPIWGFGLSYAALYSMGLPFCYGLLGERDSGYYRAATMIVTALQLFLTYFSLMLSPRIVAWRASAPERFRQRVLLVAAGLVGLGLGVCGATWALREVIIRLLCGPSFLPAAGLLPVLVFGKFAALASGVLVWALLACQKDWLPVQLCFPVVAAGFTLHWLLVPRVGTSAAAWLNWSMEASLLGLCLVAVFRLRVERASA